MKNAYEYTTFLEQNESLEKKMISTKSVIESGIILSAVFTVILICVANFTELININNSLEIGTITFTACTSVTLLVAIANHIKNKEILKEINSNKKKLKMIKIKGGFYERN